MVVTPRRVVLSAIDGAGHACIVKGSFRPNRIHREIVAHQAFASAGVPVPELLGFVEGVPSFLAVERLPGPALSSDQPSAAWRQAGALARLIHSAELPADDDRGVRPSDDWMSDIETQIRAALEDRLLPPLLASQLRVVAGNHAALVQAPGPRTVVHGDYMPKHLVFRGTRLHAIDVEAAGIHDPAWDLAVLCAFDFDRLDDVLDGYGTDAEGERRIRRVVPAYRLERLLRAVNWVASQGQPVERCIDELRTLLD